MQWVYVLIPSAVAGVVAGVAAVAATRVHIRLLWRQLDRHDERIQYLEQIGL